MHMDIAPYQYIIRRVTPGDIDYLARTFPDLLILLRLVSWSKQREAIPFLINFRNVHVGSDAFQINSGVE